MNKRMRNFFKKMFNQPVSQNFYETCTSKKIFPCQPLDQQI